MNNNTNYEEDFDEFIRQKMVVNPLINEPNTKISDAITNYVEKEDDASSRYIKEREDHMLNLIKMNNLNIEAIDVFKTCGAFVANYEIHNSLSFRNLFIDEYKKNFQCYKCDNHMKFYESICDKYKLLQTKMLIQCPQCGISVTTVTREELDNLEVMKHTKCYTCKLYNTVCDYIPNIFSKR